MARPARARNTLRMDTFIFDHVRTPRGRGKAGGSLHEVTPVWLASRPLGECSRGV